MTPVKPGFYWAKWMLVDDNIPEGYTAFKMWEPVEVYLTDYSEGTDELRVWMIGHEFSQHLDCFHWGEELPAPLDKTAAIRRQTEVLKQQDAVKRFRAMTMDERIEKGGSR